MKIARLLCVLYKDSYLCFRLSTISFRSTNCFVFYFVDIVFCREVKRFYLSYRKITKKKTWLKAFFSINYWRSVAVERGWEEVGCWVILKRILRFFSKLKLSVWFLFECFCLFVAPLAAPVTVSGCYGFSFFLFVNYV